MSCIRWLALLAGAAMTCWSVSCVEDGARCGAATALGIVQDQSLAGELVPSAPLDELIALQVAPKNEKSDDGSYGTRSQANSTWYPAPDLDTTAIDVAMSDSGKVFVITAEGDIKWVRYYGGPSFGSWQSMTGWATRVSCGIARPYVVGSYGRVYEWSGSSWVNRSFPDTAVDVAVGDEDSNYVWASDNHGRLWKYTGSNNWSFITSAVSGGIDASSNGNVWVVAGPYKYVYYKPISGSWTYASASSAFDVAAADYANNEPWALKTSGIYSRDSGTWVKEELPIYGLAGDTLYYGDAVDNSWCLGYGMETPAIIGDDGAVYAMDIPLDD